MATLPRSGHSRVTSERDYCHIVMTSRREIVLTAPRIGSRPG